jgi:hypothetical protein
VNGVVEKAEGLFDRGERIPSVELIEVDVLTAESAQ